jgi:hypothetical protein
MIIIVYIKLKSTNAVLRTLIKGGNINANINKEYSLVDKNEYKRRTRIRNT